MRRCASVSIIAAALASLASSGHGGEVSQFTSSDISLAYDSSFFDAATLSILPKVLGRASPQGPAGPKRYVVELKHQSRSQWHEGGRYYFPSSSAIYVTPLFDRSVRDFAAAYPSLHENALTLQKILLLTRRQFHAAVDRQSNGRDSRAAIEWTPFSRPMTTEQRAKQREPLALPDEPFSNTGACLLAHYKELTQPHCTGYRVLTYYRNAKAGYGATNTELHYQYQGLTADERFFVTARLAVRHDRLPDSIDDPRANSQETEAEQRAERKRINGWKAETFFPPLPALDEMIASIRVTP